MKRRTLLFGVGSTAIGGGTLVSSGAFGSARMERQASVNVVNDSDGLLALVDATDSEIVRQTEAGELTIDFTAGTGEGVNVNSEYQIGAIDDGTFSKDPLDVGNPQDDPAFRIVNNDTVDHEIGVEYAFENDAGSSAIYFQFENGGGDFAEIWWKGSDDNGLSTAITVTPGESIGVSTYIWTTDGEIGDDLTGALTVSA